MNFHGCDIKRTLYDTGSTSNFMGTQAFRKIPKNLRPKQMPINLQATCASGNNLTIKGRYEMQLTYEGKTIISDVYVVDELKNDAIIGMESILGFPLFHSVLDNTIHVGGPATKQTAFCRKSNTVQPLQTSMIELVVEENGRRVLNKEVLLDIEVPSLPHIRENCALVSTNEHGIAKCFVTNASKVQVELPRKLEIGSFQYVNRKELISLEKYLSISAINAKLEESKKRNKLQDSERIRKTINLSHLEPKLREQYYQLLIEFADVFSVDDWDLGKCNKYTHTLRLKKNAIPKYQKQFPLAHAHIEHLETYVSELVRSGVLVPQNDTDWNSALFFVAKKGGFPRAVLDYSYLNSQCIPMSYRLPLIHELIDNIGRHEGKVFTTFDLTSSFSQMPLDEKSRHLTSFHVPSLNQSFSYTTCPQGIQSAPLAFSKMQSKVFQSMIPSKLCNYIDDSLIFSKNHSNHLEDLKEALTCLRKANLKLNGRKCTIASNECTYLGYVLKENSYTLSIEHKEVLERCKEPQNAKEIRSFLGFVNYLRVLIPNYSKYSNCLSKLLRKDSNYKGGPLPKESSHAFQTLKKFICTYPTLAYPRKEGKYVLYVDAASASENCGLGNALYQEQDGIMVPIGFNSRSLLAHEKSYHPYLLEMLACVHAIEKWSRYLIGKKEVELRTDHKPLLSSFKTLKSKNQLKTLNRLEQKLLEFPNIRLTHTSGVHNPSDWLSRSLEVDVKAIQSQPYLDPESIIEFQKQDPVCQVLWHFVKTRQLPKNPAFKRMCNTFGKKCIIKNNALFVRVRNDVHAFVAPANMHAEILASGHMRGHGKLLKMLGLIQQSFSWPTIINDCLELIQNCTTCAKIAGPNKFPTVPLRPLPTVDHFGQRLNFDVFGPLPTVQNLKYILVIVDEHTRWAQFYGMESKEAEEVAKKFVDGWICRFATCPQSIFTDNGGEFLNDVLKQINKIVGSHHLTTYSYWPRANSRAESVMKYITKYIKTMVENVDSWPQYLGLLALSFNSSSNEAVGNQSPFELLFHQFPRLGILSGNETLRHYYGTSFPDVLRNRIRKVKQIASKFNLKYREAYCEKFNEKVKPMPLQENSLVWLHTPKRTKFQIEWSGPWAICTLTPTGAYIMDPISLQSKFVHRDRLKPYFVKGGLPLNTKYSDKVDDTAAAAAENASLPEQQNSSQKLPDTGPQNLYFDSPDVVVVSSPEAVAQHRPIKREEGASSSSFGPQIKEEQVTPPYPQQQRDSTVNIGSSPEGPFLSPQASPTTPGGGRSFLRMPTLEEIASPFRRSSSTPAASSSRLTRQQAAQQNIHVADQPLPGRQTAWYRKKR